MEKTVQKVTTNAPFTPISTQTIWQHCLIKIFHLTMVIPYTNRSRLNNISLSKHCHLKLNHIIIEDFQQLEKINDTKGWLQMHPLHPYQHTHCLIKLFHPTKVISYTNRLRLNNPSLTKQCHLWLNHLVIVDFLQLKKNDTRACPLSRKNDEIQTRKSAKKILYPTLKILTGMKR